MINVEWSVIKDFAREKRVNEQDLFNAVRRAVTAPQALEKQIAEAARTQSGQGAEPVFWWDGDLSDLDDCVSKEQSAYHTIPLYTHPQPAQQGSVPEGWLLTHIDDPETDGYLIKGPGMSYCAWKDKEPWLYLFCEALASATPQPQGDGWVRCEDRLPTYRDSDEYGDVWAMSKLYGVKKMSWSSVRADFESHWMPTGLKRPQPPKEGE